LLPANERGVFVQHLGQSPAAQSGGDQTAQRRRQSGIGCQRRLIERLAARQPRRQIPQHTLLARQFVG
jgi:hypothetical protein